MCRSIVLTLTSFDSLATVVGRLEWKKLIKWTGMIACNLCAMILQLVCQSQNYDWAVHPSMHSLLLILVRVVGGLGPGACQRAYERQTTIHICTFTPMGNLESSFRSWTVGASPNTENPHKHRENVQTPHWPNGGVEIRTLLL